MTKTGFQEETVAVNILRRLYWILIPVYKDQKRQCGKNKLHHILGLG